MKKILFAILAFGVFVSQSFAFDSEKMYFWNKDQVEVHLSTAFSSRLFDIEDVEKAIVDAAGQWAACGVTIRYAGRTEDEAVVGDKKNVIAWQPRIVLRGIDSVSETKLSALKKSRQITEFDITLSRRELTRQDQLVSMLLLEFGHALGILGDSPEEESVMYPVDSSPFNMPHPAGGYSTKLTSLDIKTCSDWYSKNRSSLSSKE